MPGIGWVSRVPNVGTGQAQGADPGAGGRGPAAARRGRGRPIRVTASPGARGAGRERDGGVVRRRRAGAVRRTGLRFSRRLRGGSSPASPGTSCPRTAPVSRPGEAFRGRLPVPRSKLSEKSNNVRKVGQTLSGGSRKRQYPRQQQSAEPEGRLRGTCAGRRGPGPTRTGHRLREPTPVRAGAGVDFRTCRALPEEGRPCPPTPAAGAAAFIVTAWSYTHGPRPQRAVADVRQAAARRLGRPAPRVPSRGRLLRRRPVMPCPAISRLWNGMPPMH